MNKRAPRNTARERDPLGFLLSAMTMGTSGAVENQEAAGQRSFVNSDTLPTEMREATRVALEACGFKFLGPVEGDSLFQYVEMPKGWSKRPTSHSMWSELLDDKGRKRGAIFYKAAFYDRKAHMSLDARYGCGKDYDALDPAPFLITDGGKTIHTIDHIPVANAETWERDDATAKAAEGWLNERYPEWRNPAAYWDAA